MKQFSKPVLMFLLLLGLAGSLQAQDPHFSQYYATPWNLNPALSGVFNGRWRASAIYRDQWSSFLAPVPFRTYSASFEYRNEVGNDDYATFGVGAMHDEAGTAKFVQNRVHLSAAYLKQLSGGRYKADQFLSAGAQIGFGQNSIDWTRLWFSRQFDPTAEKPDFSLANGEANANASSKAFLDFNAGLLWYVVYDNDGYFYLGAAMHHINAPAISLADNGSTTLYARWTGHAGGMFPLSHNFAMMPGLLVMRQGPSMQGNLGLNFRYANNDFDELAMRAGVWTRIANKLDKGFHADAVAIVGMVEWHEWTMGLSYDITVSKLTAANNSRGAFELSLNYVKPMQRRQRVICPVF